MHMVAAGGIDCIEPVSKDNHCAVLRSGATLPISRGGYQSVKELPA